MSDWGKRLSLFQAGQRYRARSAFKGLVGPDFVADEVLVFNVGGYSRYDECYVYEFRSEISGERKNWWLDDGTSADSWRTFFEAID